MSAIDEALRQLGVGDIKNAAAAVALSGAIDTFGIDNAGPMGAVIKDVALHCRVSFVTLTQAVYLSQV